MTLETNCTSCHATLKVGEYVALWDNQPYCKACVYDVSPDLLALAEANKPLEDEVLFSELCDPSAIRSLYLGLSSFVLLIIGAIVCGVLFLPAKIVPLYCGAMIFILATGLLVMGMERYISKHPNHHFPLRIAIHNGHLHIDGPNSSHVISLDEWSWFIGNARQASRGVSYLTAPVPALIMLARGTRIAFALDAAQRQRFAAFLRLARVRHLPDLTARGEALLFLRHLGTGIVWGLLMGVFVGVIGNAIGRPGEWFRAGIFTGFLDGAFTAVLSFDVARYQGGESGGKTFMLFLFSLLFGYAGSVLGDLADDTMFFTLGSGILMTVIASILCRSHYKSS